MAKNLLCQRLKQGKERKHDNDSLLFYNLHMLLQKISKAQDEGKFKVLAELFESALHTQLSDPDRYGKETFCNLVVVSAAYFMVGIKKEEFTKYAVAHVRQMTADSVELKT